MKSSIPILIVAMSISSSATAFQLFPNQHGSFSSIHTTCLAMGGPQSDNNSIQRPRNEFSRTVSPDQVLKLHGKHADLRQYSVDIDATPEECRALALRFQLPEIATLTANLNLSPEGRMDNRARGILVEGTARATVTQTCVRTNEPFEQALEFPIFTIVRPVDGGNGNNNNNAMLSSLLDNNSGTVPLTRSTKKKKNGSRRSSSKKQNYYSDELALEQEEREETVMNDPRELLQLQTMLETMELKEEDLDDVFEDAAIFATNQMLDVGELLSQLLWLQLDPYPRKPGGPEKVQYTISG